MNKLKLITVVGTRPEIIRLSRTMSLLDEHLTQIIVHTGQNYDYELNEIFWKDLQLRKPDYFLGINTSSVGKSVADIISKTEEVIKTELPDAVLILGDTNSSLSAYIAKRMHIPIFHMEAGNRSFDYNVPEEVNRRIVDSISDFNLVYTEHARRHLISEGHDHRRIYLTGSPMKEVIDFYLPKIKKSKILEKLSLIKNKFFLVSIHREENVDNYENLTSIIKTLNELANIYKLKIIVSTHPRTQKRINKIKGIKINKLINWLKPFGYLDYVNLQMNSICTISDSGTISEESSILNFPAVSLRQSMERPEAQDTGSIILTGFDSNIVLESVRLSILHHNHDEGSIQIPDDYKITNTSWRVLKLIIGNTGLSNIWHGIKKNNK